MITSLNLVLMVANLSIAIAMSGKQNSKNGCVSFASIKTLSGAFWSLRSSIQRKQKRNSLATGYRLLLLSSLSFAFILKKEFQESQPDRPLICLLKRMKNTFALL